jgi:hypothetical protein
VFFGADGEDAAHTANMLLRNIVVARNRISGFFSTAAIFGQLPVSAWDIQIVDNVVVNSRDTDVRFDFHYVAGILLSQQSLHAKPASLVAVRRNRVTASGKHAVLSMGGIALKIATSMPGLTLSDNEVQCLGCPIDVIGDAVRSGISFWSGTFDKLSVHGNRVVGANDALRMEGYATITNGSITDNEFIESRSVGRLLGQITLIALSGQTIQGEISGNTIADGAGHGISCEGDGTFLLTGLANNAFARNAADDVAGCP